MIRVLRVRRDDPDCERYSRDAHRSCIDRMGALCREDKWTIGYRLILLAFQHRLIGQQGISLRILAVKDQETKRLYR